VILSSRARKDRQDKGGRSQRPPFFFASELRVRDAEEPNDAPLCVRYGIAVIVHLHMAGKAAYLDPYASKPPCKVLAFEIPALLIPGRAARRPA